MTTFQASCVAIAGRALLIEGPPGSGKTSLALALIDRGAHLIGDDAVTLAEQHGRLWALPPPNIPGLIEIRNVGVVEMPATSAPVGLLLSLDPGAPRFVEEAARRDLAGHPIPTLRFDSRDAIAALRAEHALRIYGLADTA